MGQESSLPQNVGDELERPSRMSPSASNIGTGSRQASARPSKVINAMLQRASGNSQAGSGYEYREKSRAAAEAGQMAHTGGQAIPLNGGDHSQQHQQSYYQQHQQQLYYQQQQGMQNQYNHPSVSQAIQSHPNAVPISSSHSPSDFVGDSNRSDRNGPRGSMRSVRGAALINSMRNLTLGRGSKKDISDWETKWDEDDDSEAEDETDVGQIRGSAASAANLMSKTSPMHQPQRPGMDEAHSSISLPPAPPMVKAQQRTSLTPQAEASIDFSTEAERNMLMQESTSAMKHADRGIYAKKTMREAQLEDTVEWDTGAQFPQDGAHVKPSVQMFLPLLRVLGKGSFGKVVLVQKRVGKERGSLFAMKILRKAHLVKRRQIERTRTERKVLSAVNHPFIMKLHYAFQTTDKLYLVLDYCPGGELFFHLSRFRRFPERVARFYSAELLLAIGHLHKRGIIYRDLKPENVLLDAEGHVKLGDFGLAKAGLKHPCEGATSMCGTPEYMAPEVLSQQGHGFCVDYWGLGMLVYEMMTGLPPWYTTDRSKLFRRLKSAPLEIPSYFSTQSANCVSALLERNPRRRLGVTGVRTAMEHEFFRSINWRALYGRLVEAPVRPCEGWAPPEAVRDNVFGDSLQGFQGTGIEQMDSGDLDAATANFDNTFTRMPVETEDGAGDCHSDDGETEELREDTFLGFSFDDKDREAITAATRQRTQHFVQQQQQLQHHPSGHLS